LLPLAAAEAPTSLQCPSNLQLRRFCQVREAA
jgi:hypothetical protein